MLTPCDPPHVDGRGPGILQQAVATCSTPDTARPAADALAAARAAHVRAHRAPLARGPRARPRPADVARWSGTSRTSPPTRTSGSPTATAACALLHPELAAIYDAFETPRAVRGDLELLDLAGALRLPRRGPRAHARGARERGRRRPRPRRDVLRHELQHTETMRQAMALGGLLPAGEPPARPRRAERRRLGRRPRRHRSRSAPAPTASPTTTSARATRRDVPRLPHRPPPGHQRDVAALRRGRRLRPPRVVERRGLGLEGGVRHHAPRRRGRGARRGARLPRLLVRGRRLRPVARRPSAHRGRVGEGGDLGTSWTAARPRVGVDRLDRSPATPASSPTPTASTPRSSSATATASCAAAPGPTHPRVATATFRNWDLPQRRQIFAGVRLARDLERHLMEPTTQPRARSWSASYLGAGDERALADDVLDGLTRPFKELPPKHFYDARGAELFDQICDLPEYYPTRTERAILDARARRDRRAHRRRRARRARLGHRGQDARAAERAGRRRDAAPLRARSTSPRGWCATSPTRWSRSYPGLRCTAIVGDFERHLEHVPAPDGPRIVAFLGGTIGNFTPGLAPALPAPARASCCGPTTACCSAPTSSRTRRSSRPPTTTRRRHRRVQPQRAARRQPRARRRLRPRRVRARRVLRPRARVDRDAPARRSAR